MSESSHSLGLALYLGHSELVLRADSTVTQLNLNAESINQYTIQ